MNNVSEIKNEKTTIIRIRKKQIEQLSKKFINHTN